MLTIPKTMRAVVYRGPNDLRLETLPVPDIGPVDLLVRVAVCGVCPTDIKKIVYGTVPPPRIFGHETAGVIVRVGRRVKGFKNGERIALHHHVPCLKCHACRHRAFAQCNQYKHTGITAGFEPAGGGYAEYVRVMPGVLPGVVKIPARNTFLEGAMLEPVNTVLKAVKRLAILRGDTVLVAGQGPIGLMFTRLLALQGMQVIATDLFETRLRLARRFGARWTVRVQNKKPDSGRDDFHVVPSSHPPLHPSRTPSRRRSRSASSSIPLAELVERVTHGRKLDAAVLAVPSDAVMREAQTLVRGGGQVLLFSHTRRGDEATVDLGTVCVDEKDLIGSYSADFLLQDEVTRIVFSRRLDTRRLVSHQFTLSHTAAAISLASHPGPDSLKIIVNHQLDEGL